MIRADGVTKIFGPRPNTVYPLIEQGKTKEEIQAETGHILGVKNASFDVPQGEVFAIMGLSGSGKSTLIRCVNRIIDPTSGQLTVDDPEEGALDVTGMGPEALRQLRRRQMSMVFQHFALFPHRTVLSNTVYGLEIQGREKADRERVGREVLEAVGLAQWAQAFPSQLSGGMQQRVGLARALATDASILLMDEPFSALDPLIRVHMQQELKKIQQSYARTILFITHDLDEAMSIGDRIAIMEDAEIVQIGTPEEILVNPRTEYVERFVEHADPTGVISAGTVALPFQEPLIEKAGTSGSTTYYRRAGYGEVTFGIDGEGRLVEAQLNGRSGTIQQLDKALAETNRTGGRRQDDLFLVCRADAVLQRLLRGRALTTRAMIVVDDQDRVVGLADEPEIISGILEKRANRALAQPQGAGNAPAAASGA